MVARLAALFFLVALLAAPAAAGDGPMPAVQQFGPGVLAKDGASRFVAVPAGSLTVLEQIAVPDGRVMRSVDLPGSWGVPTIAYGEADGAGLSSDGRVLVLGDTPREYPRRTSSFLVVSTKTMRVLHGLTVKGDFAFDALAPGLGSLYLIQHVDPNNTQRYVVRRYDLAGSRLVPGRIADRTQKGWVMAGYPQARATSPDGRMVYTLYQNPGGYPFVHALDTVRAVAHCVGLPWTGDAAGFSNMRLSLRDRARTVAEHWLGGRPWRTIDVGTWRVATDEPAGFPWLGVGAGIAAAAAGLLALALRRRRAPGTLRPREV